MKLCLFSCRQFCLLTALMIVASSAASVKADESPTADAQTYWIFLTTGKGTEGREKSEIEQMQAAHLANFGRLYEEGQLLIVGPMADPQKKLRGIVVVTAPDRKALPGLFDSDPYVQHGILTIDACKIDICVGDFQKVAKTTALAEYQLVLLEKSAAGRPEADADLEEKNVAYCQSIHNAEQLCFAGWLRDDADARRGILIFHKLDDDRLKMLVDAVPAVSTKLWKATTFPLYMGEGVVK